MAPIIEDWVSDSKDESEPNDPKSAPSFVQPSKKVKPSGHSTQSVKAPILDHTPKPTSSKTNGSRKRKNRKTCFVCRGVDHLIKDCTFHVKPKTQPIPRNYVHRGYDKQYALSTQKYPQKHRVPAVVFTKSKPVSVTAARPVSDADPKIMAAKPRHAYSLHTKNNSIIRRHQTPSKFSKTSNSSLKVTASHAKVVSAAKGKKGKWVWRPKHQIPDHDSRASNLLKLLNQKDALGNPQYALKDKGVIDSGCSRHMTGNMSYLSDFQELNEGYIAFGDFKLPDESQVLLRVPRENNMYNVNLKDIVPSRNLTCLFAKATIDASNLWKEKQHRASCKTNPVSSVTQPLFRLHMNLFGPKFVKSLNKKCYCLVITDDYSRFTWVFFLATKDETSSILKTFVTGLENQLSLKVKVNRSDNGTEFKNSDLNQFYSSNDVSAASPIVPAAGQNCPNSTNPISVGDGNSSLRDASQSPDVLEMENIVYSDNENVGADADFNILESSITVSPIPTTRIHNAHPILQIIEEPKRVHQALKDPSWIEAMQEELLQFKMQKVWILVDLPQGKREIGTKWVNKNKKDERGIVVRNKGRLVTQGHTQEEGIDYEEVFAPVAMIEAIRLFLAYASFMGFMVYQMDIKSAFLYGTIEEEVYVYQPPGFEDPDHPDKVYKVVKALYGLYQAPRAWYETLANYLLQNGFHRGQIDQTLFVKKQK
nr:putative ribonuclease H-like domain-containing protein [Tanacetum cinerariifolium]